MIKAQPTSQLRSCATRSVKPFTGFSRRGAVRVRAGPESNGVVTSAAGTAAAAMPVPVPEYSEDTETIRDVFAFSGPAPERVNGRVAMYGFAAIAYTELQAHTPCLEQFGQQGFGVIFISLLITVATLIPKLASGTSLKVLNESATSANMTGPGWKQFLGLFDTNFELWTGRVAMVGILGLAAFEMVKGDSFF